MARKPYRIEPYVSKTGPIPDDHWENEMTEPTSIEKIMGPEEAAKFRAETEALRIKPAKKSGDQ